MPARAALVFVLATTSLLACSAAPSDDGESGGDAVTQLGRARSPLASGVYDSADGILRLAGVNDKQVLNMTYTMESDGDREVGLCNGDVDVSLIGSKTTLTDDIAHCALTLVAAAKGGIDVSGNLGLGLRFAIPGKLPGAIHFARRAANALKGDYAGTAAVLSIESSDDASFTYTLTNAGKTERGKATIAGDGSRDEYVVSSAGCTGQLSISRDKGAFSVVGRGETENKDLIARCPLQNDIFFAK